MKRSDVDRGLYEGREEKEIGGIRGIERWGSDGRSKITVTRPPASRLIEVVVVVDDTDYISRCMFYFSRNTCSVSERPVSAA